MTRSRRRVFPYLLLAALVLGGSTAIYLRSARAAEDVCTLARRHLPKLIGLDAVIGSCVLDPLTQTVRFRDVALSEPGAEAPLLAADEVEVSLGAVSPFFGSVELDRIRVTRPRLAIDLTRPRPPRAPGACRVDGLDRLDIRRLEIHDAEVRVALPGGRAVEVGGGDVSWLKRKGRPEIHLTATTGRVVPRPGEELELTALSLDARLHPDDERLEINRAELALGGMSLEGSGELQHFCDPEVALEATAFVPLSALAQALDFRKSVAGHLWARMSVEGPLAQPAISADVAASDVAVGNYAPGGFDARLSLRGRELRIDSFETSAGAGVIRARGTLELSGRLPLALEAELDRAEFGPVLAKAGLRGSWVDFPATGRVRLAGHALPSLHLEGDASFKAGAFVLANRPYDVPQPAGKRLLEFNGAQASTNVVVLADRVELAGIRIEGRSTRLLADATLHYAPERGLIIRGQAEHLDLSELGHIASLRWAGHGSAQFTVQGPYGDPRIEAALNLRDFEFWRFSLGVIEGRLAYKNRVLSFPSVNGQKGRTQYQGSAELRFEKKDIHAKASIRIPGGRTEDLVDVLMPMHENVELFQGVLEGDVAGTVQVDSYLDAFEGTVALDLSNTRYYGRRLGDGRAVLRFVDGEAMILEKTALRGPLGVIEADGTWHFDGPLDYRFRLTRGSLGELVGPDRAQKLGLSGELAASGKVG
ncbi:MAG TPA: translocation/assembly module TamB, partial [Myxococcaceae bacterium]|nr:translocation/assembly module TamB [Myxococcaceae bacterium]